MRSSMVLELEKDFMLKHGGRFSHVRNGTHLPLPPSHLTKSGELAE